MHASVRKMEKDEQNGMAPQVIGRAIVRQLRRRTMVLSLTPRLDYKLLTGLSRILPDGLMMWIVGMLYA